MKNLIAIMRGIKPEEALAAAEALLSAGFIRMEITLNSPHPLESIALIVKEFGTVATVGAGTVLSVAEVTKVADIGCRFVVSPNCNTAVIQATKKAGMDSIPGVGTASECFTAIDAGADALKLFPATQIGVSGCRALKAVLPPHIPVLAVGGVDETQFDDWLAAGAVGFGIGSDLYRSGMVASDINQRAKKIITAYQMALDKTTN